jgi:thiamine pyrophosphokinase
VQVETVVVVAAGEGPDVMPRLAPDATVIAADGGLDRARELGLEVTLAIGDFDSATERALVAAEAQGTRIVRHPAAKDATDLELAIDGALALRPERIAVVGSAGGRLDHLLAFVHLLASPKLAGVTVDGHVGEALVHVVRDERRLSGTRGELITLMAVHGPAEGVCTEGLAYPLHRETLEPGSSRGVSNVFAADTARVSLERGVLLAIRPRPPEERTP